MKTIKPVSLSNGAFLFCKISLATLLWICFIFRLKWLLIIIFLIFLFSAVFKIRRAPMILLYTYTINLVFPSKTVMLDENAMRFVHALAAAMALIGLILLYLIYAPVGWGFLFFFAILKTISALGYCPASKLYSCALSNGSCCNIIKGKKKC
jgi:hypothetical protein